MVQAESVLSSDFIEKKSTARQYDHIKAVINIARKNGWDLENMGLVPVDLTAKAPLLLTRKEVIEQNRLLKNTLERFCKILTSPVPADLQRHILRKEACMLLPWEKEALSKMNRWRREFDKARPGILEELRRVLQ